MGIAMNKTKATKTPSWKRNNPPLKVLDDKQLEEIRAWLRESDFVFWKTRLSLNKIRKRISTKYKRKTGKDQLKNMIADGCKFYRKIRLVQFTTEDKLLDGKEWEALSLVLEGLKEFASYAASVNDVCLLVTSVGKFRNCNPKLLDGIRESKKWWKK